jgi:cellulose synthase (UDP-forming)
LILPQLVAVVALVLACVIGAVRLWAGATTTVVGTGVNVLWVAYDLLVMSVIFQAAAYRAPEPEEESVA